ncbi:MAG: hypothetical protein Q8Q46_03175 [Candidatus Giovannonibacteria bacterium]|nr:hypothetical protein [Candidatus Giovannonibacteria bacterium]
MSVINLTFSYVRPYIYQASGALEDLNFRKKKKLLKNLLFVFIALAVFYIYLTGAVVSQNFKRNDLEKTLNKNSMESAGAESAFISESYDKSMEYFKTRGYEEPKNLEIIRTAGSVAVENAEKQNFY